MDGEPQHLMGEAVLLQGTVRNRTLKARTNPSRARPLGAGGSIRLMAQRLYELVAVTFEFFAHFTLP